MCNNGDNMNVVFYDGDNFPDKKTFERTAYQEAILLENGEILGFREGIIYRFLKGKEKKFAVCFHKRHVKFSTDKFGNVFFLENSSKISKAFKVRDFDNPKMQAFYSLEKIKDYCILSERINYTMLFVMTALNILEIFEEHKLIQSYNPHIIEDEKIDGITVKEANTRFDSFLICLNITTADQGCMIKIFKF